MSKTVQRKSLVMGLCVSLLMSTALLAQVRQEIRVPDILGYTTLKCDLHTHTVFSDGSVWPTVRVDEAWREGLDAISITDHIEYQPHEDDIPANLNRPYEIALARANERGILLIRGAEITRDTPPGHFNAIFLDDVKPLDTNDLLDVMAAADRQGAFIFWNHPGWKPDKEGWLDIHTTLYEKKYLRGIEVVNGSQYYPKAHRWALDKGLTFVGNSDIHAPSMLEKTTPENHRTMTLVFASGKTVPALKEALVEGRTAVWHEDQLIGRREYLDAIFGASVRVTGIEHRDNDVIAFRLKNGSDIGFEMERTGQIGPRSLALPPGAMALVKTKVADVAMPVELEYVVRNLLTGPNEGLPVTLTIPGRLVIEVEVQVEEVPD